MLQRGAILSGKYRIDSVLGEGGMAVVYAVTHLRNAARLAVKVLHESSERKGHLRARFVREGKVANSVNHPGAVLMIDDGIAEDGSPYLVMERLNGVCVDNMGARGIPLSAALNIAYQVLDVLRAAHANGVIHRDIKPANLFVLRDGRVKVLDFGISRLRDAAEPFDSIANGSVMGTPFFMAPEQARANTSEIDTRTDLFAVGATLFTLISGEYLYTGDDARQVVTQAATQPARSLACVAPDTPQAVIDLVAKAVAYDSAARWESAEAMQDAVREVHERLWGPIGFEALASLLLVREFQRKSHAQLAGPIGPQPWSSGALEPSPLATTLPAAADVIPSRGAHRAANDASSSREAPSSRVSAGPAQLAGWTGDVPAPIAQRGPATQTASRFGRILSKPRVVHVGVLAGATVILLFGFAHCQTPSGAVAAKSPVASDPPTPISPPADLTTAGIPLVMASLPPPTLLSPSVPPAKLAGPSKPVGAPPSTRVPTSEVKAAAEPANRPTIVRFGHRSAP